MFELQQKKQHLQKSHKQCYFNVYYLTYSLDCFMYSIDLSKNLQYLQVPVAKSRRNTSNGIIEATLLRQKDFKKLLHFVRSYGT